MADGAEVGRIKIRVMPDLDNFRRELKAKLEEIEKDTRGKVHVDVEVDSDGAKQHLRDTLAELKAMTAKNLKIGVDVDVDRNRLQNALSGAFGKGGGGGGFGGGGALSLLSNQGLWMGLGVAALGAPALALLSGALATLPALLSAVVAPAAAVALGLQGIKQAAEDAGLIGEGKKGKTTIGQQLKDLQSAVSDTFHSKLTPVFEQLDKVFTPLKAGLPLVAAGVSDLAAGFVNAMTSTTGLSQIQSILGNIGKLLSGMAPGIQSFTGGLLGLADQVSAKFPAVADWFKTVGDSFSNWVKKQSQVSWFTGKSPMDTAMSNLGDTLKELGGLGVDVLQKGFEFLSDPNFGKSMHNFVTDVKSLVDNVLPGMKTLFEQITGFLDPIASALDKVNNFKPPEWMHLGGDPSKNVGAFPGMQNPNEGKPPGTLDKLENGQAFDETKNSFGLMVATIEGMAAELWVNLKLGAAQAIVDIGTTLGSLPSTIANAFSTGSTAFTTIFDTLKGVVSAKFGELVTTAIQGGTNLVIGLANAWQSLPSVASSIFSGLKSTVVSTLAGLVGDVIAKGVEITNEVSSWAGKITAAASNIAGALSGIGAQMIAGFLAGFRGAAAQAVVEVGEWAGKIAAAAKNALGIHSPSKVFNDIGNYTAQGLGEGLAQGFPAVIQQAQALAQKLTEAMNGGLDGSNMGKGFQDDIKQTLAQLEIQRKQLKVQLDATPKDDKEGRKAIQSQMDQITALKDQLGLQKDVLGYGQKYSGVTDSTSEAAQMITHSLAQGIDALKGFAMSNVKQFESDIGISGNGAIPTIAETGIGWLTNMIGKGINGAFGVGGGKTEIHVNSVDEALAAKQNQDNKQALQYARR